MMKSFLPESNDMNQIHVLLSGIKVFQNLVYPV